MILDKQQATSKSVQTSDSPPLFLKELKRLGKSVESIFHDEPNKTSCLFKNNYDINVYIDDEDLDSPTSSGGGNRLSMDATNFKMLHVADRGGTMRKKYSISDMTASSSRNEPVTDCDTLSDHCSSHNDFQHYQHNATATTANSQDINLTASNINNNDVSHMNDFEIYEQKSDRFKIII